MALKLGEGGESYAPLARVIVGGLLMPLIFSVLLVPAAHYLYYRNRDSHAGTARRSDEEPYKLRLAIGVLAAPSVFGATRSRSRRRARWHCKIIRKSKRRKPSRKPRTPVPVGGPRALLFDRYGGAFGSGSGRRQLRDSGRIAAEFYSSELSRRGRHGEPIDYGLRAYTSPDRERDAPCQSAGPGHQCDEGTNPLPSDPHFESLRAQAVLHVA